MNPTIPHPTPSDAPRLLEAFDLDQHEVAEHLESPLCVLAGAGIGKTRAITYHIAHGVVTGAYQATQVLAITFATHAAGEMRSRLADLGVPGTQACTLYVAALRQLTHFWSAATGRHRPDIQVYKVPLAGTAARHLSLPTDRATVRDLTAEVGWAKTTITLSGDYVQTTVAADRTGVARQEATTIAQALSPYEGAKNERDIIDSKDVLPLTIRILLDREDVAVQVCGQYKHFVTDEYRDVSPPQQRLLDLRLGRRYQLCAVGGVPQTIYSFTGAMPTFLTGFTIHHEGVRTVRLSRDYCPAPQVVSLVNRVLSRSRHGGGGLHLPAGAVELAVQRPSGPAVRFETYDNDIAEAEGAVTQVHHLQVVGIPLGEIAIPYHTNSQSEVFEQVLAGAQTGYLVRGSKHFFECEEAECAMAVTLGTARTKKATLTEDLGQDAHTVLSREGWSEEPPAPRGAVRERQDTLNALVVLTDEMAQTCGADLDAFHTELCERTGAQNALTVEDVTLSSLHTTKGLERDAIILVDVCEELLPISLTEGQAAIEKERRLLYVGVTRARERLIVSYTRARNVRGRASRKPSRFLNGLWPTSYGSRDASRYQGRQSTKEHSRQSATDFKANNDPRTIVLSEKLRVWHSQIAKEWSRPAYTVFADATLQDIAVVKPISLSQLSLIHGVGATKLQDCDGPVLALLRDFEVGD